MVNAKEAVADFQMLAYRVSKFEFETNNIEDAKGRIKPSIKFDYNILDANEKEKTFQGTLQFIVNVKIKKGEDSLIKLNLSYEAKFIGNKKALSLEKFVEMMQLNGVATLMHIARSYILTTSAAAGITPPIKIPMINIYKLKEKKETSE